jgi:hypothetical protein
MGKEGRSGAWSDTSGIGASRTIFGWSNVPAMLVSFQCELFVTSLIIRWSRVGVLLNPIVVDLTAPFIGTRQEILP